MPESVEPVRAAGVVARSPQGRVLMVRRVDDGTWAFPAGKLKTGETAERAAWREFAEETGYRLGGLKFLMRRCKDDGDGMVDFSTFLAPVESEFVPTLNHEASAFGWFSPDDILAENRTESMAIADSATPIVGSGGHAELERALGEGMLADEAERSGADQDRLGEEGPAVPAPLYPIADQEEGLEDLVDDPDPDDISDEDADLILSVIGDLEERMARLEERMVRA